MKRRDGVDTSSGIGLLMSVGVAIAVQISWGLNHSILWAPWHGVWNWFYVIYRVIKGVY